MIRCYYDLKYPYLQYSFTDTDGDYIMFSVPPSMLAKEYEKKIKKKPKTFFDCGAAIGVVVQLAMDYGMNAHGIDIKKYPPQHQSFNWIKNMGTHSSVPNYKLQELFKSNRIQIKSILECKPIKADIAYCNGTLTYFDEKTLPNVLSKFQNVGMLCAIHNTTEDVMDAAKMGEKLGTCNEPRTIRSKDWWIENFYKNNFDAQYNDELRTFLAFPRQK